MEHQIAGWGSLIVIAFISLFGVSSLIGLFASLIVFVFGATSYLYIKLGNVEKFCAKPVSNPLSLNLHCDRKLKNIKLLLTSPKKVPRSDDRVTGSELIDSSLQEILGFIIRDYVKSWYNLISSDPEFYEMTVRQTVKTIAVNISNRIKDVEWVPYLTQQLVDDAATHLKLYKQARTKMKHAKCKESSQSTRKASPTKKTIHKRTKSETDVSWYFGKSIEFKKESENAVGNSKFYTSEVKTYTFEEYFFQLEYQMEESKICRDAICTDTASEKEFLSEVIELLLYALLPDEDFNCKPLRFLLRDLLANAIVLPLFDIITDPDYLNQIILSLCCRNTQMSSEEFLTILRLSESQEELQATKNLLQSEMHNLRSRDSGGEDLAIKQQLSSLSYVNRLIDARLAKIVNLNSADSMDLEPISIEKLRNIDLTLEQILKDNLGLSYFMDFMSSQGKQMDLFFYLNIEGWRDSVGKELNQLRTVRPSSDHSAIVYETIRSTALSIYEQYLSNEERVQIDENTLQSVHFKIRNLNEVPNECWFDRIQEILFEKMKIECLGPFKKSKIYIKLLHELDLVPQNFNEEDSASLNSIEYSETWKTEGNNYLTIQQSPRMKHVRSLSDVTVFKNGGMAPFCAEKPQDTENLTVENAKEFVDLRRGDFELGVNIIETGIVCEKGKTFGIYAVRVTRQFSTGYLEEWHIYRRYSDFYDLYTKVKEKYCDLSKLAFPGKKTFHNMDRQVLEKRMKMLGSYMGELCQTTIVNSHVGLKELLMSFLEQGEYDRATCGPIAATINTLVNPIKLSMKSIRNVPEHLINTVDEVVGGWSKVFLSGKSDSFSEIGKVGAAIGETDDNIPLRIMLLLMDEVFDLKSRNQWLRRRIVTILRQIVRTMFGDIVNRRILDYVSFITSPKNVAYYLHMFKKSYWPNGVRSEQKLERSPDTKNRTRIAAKAALLSCLSDELKHIIGSETTRKGLLTVFDLIQRPVLNRRLMYVLIEGILGTIFPEKDLATLFCKLYAKSKQQTDVSMSNSNIS